MIALSTESAIGRLAMFYLIRKDVLLSESHMKITSETA